MVLASCSPSPSAASAPSCCSSWPPLLKQIVLAYLLVFLIVRLVLVLGRILLAPGAERFRVIPMATSSARFWFVWTTVLVGWFFFVQVTLDLLAVLGVSRSAGYLVGLACGVVLVGLTLYVVWRHPARRRRRAGRAAGIGSAPGCCRSTSSSSGCCCSPARRPRSTSASSCCCCRSRCGASISRSLTCCARPGSAAADAAVPSLTAVTVERGLRAALLIGGAYLIAWLLGLDFAAMTTSDTMATRLLRGAINAVVILLLADFAWHLARAWIDCRLVRGQRRRRGRGRRGPPPGAPAHAPADPQERPARRPRRDGRADGALGARRPGRAADRRRRRGRGRGRLRRADAGQGHHLRDVLPARRRLSGRRVHHQRQLQRDGRILLAALDQAPPPPRLLVHGAVRGAGRGPEHEPRLGDRQADVAASPTTPTSTR